MRTRVPVSVLLSLTAIGTAIAVAILGAAIRQDVLAIAAGQLGVVMTVGLVLFNKLDDVQRASARQEVAIGTILGLSYDHRGQLRRVVQLDIAQKETLTAIHWGQGQEDLHRRSNPDDTGPNHRVRRLR